MGRFYKDGKIFIDTEESAKSLGITTRQLNRILKDNRVPRIVIKRRRCYYVNLSDLEIIKMLRTPEFSIAKEIMEIKGKLDYLLERGGLDKELDDIQEIIHLNHPAI